MARDSQAALVALNRFGFGARGGASGDFEAAASDPRGFVKSELAKPNVALLASPGLMTSPDLGVALFNYRKEVQAQRATQKATSDNPAAAPAASSRSLTMTPPQDASMAQPPAASTAPMIAQPTAPAMAQPQVQQAPPQPLNVIQKTFRAEALARLQRATLAEVGFVERLVAFWSNHFCISANKGGLARMWAGSFEREAIRPHVLGHFADMLKRSEEHTSEL